jgi:hypothetical protein
MNLQKYKTIVVVVEAGMGCHHLANLIATSPKLADRVEDSSTDYTAALTNFYSLTSPNAHIFQLVVEFDSILQPKLRGIVERAELPYVFGGHLQAIYGKTGDALRQLGDVLLLLGVSDRLNESIQKRAGPDNAKYFLENYQKNKVAELVKMPLENIIEFDPNLLFQNDSTELLTFLNQTLELDLDIDFCQDLHSKWFTNITRYLKFKEIK